MTQLKLSVVIPAFNAARFIAAAIDSVIDQHYPGTYEIIVVNDGSTDGTGEIVEAYGGPVRHIRQSNQGPATARNTGVIAARHPLVLLLDADDIALPGRLERQAAFMEARPEIDICFGNWIVEGENDDYLARYGIAAPAHTFVEVVDPLPRLLARGSFVPTSTVAIRRTAYLESGMQPKGAFYAEDYALWCEVAARGGRFACCGAPLAWYRTASDTRLTRSGHTYTGLVDVLGKALVKYGHRLDPQTYEEALARFHHAANILLRHDWWTGGRKRVRQRLASLDPPLPAAMRRRWALVALVPAVIPRLGRQLLRGRRRPPAMAAPSLGNPCRSV